VAGACARGGSWYAWCWGSVHAALARPLVLGSLFSAFVVPSLGAGCATPIPVDEELASEDDEQTSADEKDDENEDAPTTPGSEPAAPSTSEGPDAGTAPDPPPGQACPTVATCEGAVTIGAIAGDTGTGGFVRAGAGSAFLRLRVVEVDDGYVGRGMRFTATLSPESVQAYDLVVHRGCSSDSSAEEAKEARSSVTQSWGESLVPNGKDDSRDLVVEVRQVAPCTNPPPWRLAVSR